VSLPKPTCADCGRALGFVRKDPSGTAYRCVNDGCPRFGAEVVMEVDPRTEADAQVARALQVVVDAGDEHDRRDYTPDELDTLFFALGMALVQLRKMPGGKEARDRFYERAEGVLTKRGRRDILEKLDAEAKIDRIGAALDALGVPRMTGYGEPVSAGQPLDAEARVLRLGSERDQLLAELNRLRLPARSNHRRVMRTVAVRKCDLTEAETAYAHPTGTADLWEVERWEDSDAVKLVRRAFGDDVDLSDGTFGDTMVKAIAVEMSNLDKARDQLLKLASTLRPREDEP